MNEQTRIWQRVLFLRVVAIVTAFAFIPAFMYGVVSIWTLVFSLVIALRFRAGLVDLNQKIDEVEDITKFYPRLSLWAIVGECVLYSYIAFGIFLIIYGLDSNDWPSIDTQRLDDQIDFWSLFARLHKMNMADRYLDVFQFVAASATMSSFIFICAFILLSTRQYCKFSSSRLSEKSLVKRLSHGPNIAGSNYGATIWLIQIPLFFVLIISWSLGQRILLRMIGGGLELNSLFFLSSLLPALGFFAAIVLMHMIARFMQSL